MEVEVEVQVKVKCGDVTLVVQDVLVQMVEQEDALHWLSTLGGAYSNLGYNIVILAHVFLVYKVIYEI